MNVSSIVQLDALSKLDASSLPVEFRLFQFGDNATSKGTFKLDAEGAAAVMAAYQEHGAELAIDYEHQTFESAKNGAAAPAAGWFVPEVRTDGIYATKVRWTARAAEMLRSREYRYFSPVFTTDKDKRITRLMPAALTNFPATKQQQPLVAAKEGAGVQKTIDTRIKMNIATLIGLKDDAAEDQVSERVIALSRTERRLLEVTNKETVAEAMSEVLAAAEARTELETARKQLKAWEERHASEELAERRRQINAIVEGAVMDGRVSLKNTDRIDQLKRHGEEYGVPALKQAVALIDPRPARIYAAPPPVNTLKAQMAAIEAYKREHKDATTADAYVALAEINPALFAETGRE